MAEEAKKSRSFLTFLWPAVVAVDTIVLGVAVFVIYKNTVGWVAPVTLEQQLRQLHQEKEKLIAEGRNPQNQIIELAGGELFVDALTVPFEDIVTNLNGLPSRMIKVGLAFKVRDEYTYQQLASPEGKSRARDAIIRILQSKTYSDLETLQGKLLLKDEIGTRLNQILKEGVVQDVYLTDFVIQ